MTNDTYEDMDEPQIETAAREQGWRPEEEHDSAKPPRGGFKDALTFLKRGDEILPIVKGVNAKLQKQLTNQQKEIDDLKSSAKQANAFLQDSLRHKAEENERLQRDLQTEKAAAITAGDGDAYQRAESDLVRLQQQPPVQPYDQVARESTISAWIAENPWYTDNPTMREWADGYANVLKQANVPEGVERLRRVAEEAVGRFPAYFDSESGQGAVPGDVHGGGRRKSTGVKKTFDDLPSDAQDAYYQFRKLIPDFSKSQYLSEYEWE